MNTMMAAFVVAGIAVLPSAVRAEDAHKDFCTVVAGKYVPASRGCIGNAIPRTMALVTNSFDHSSPGEGRFSHKISLKMSKTSTFAMVACGDGILGITGTAVGDPPKGPMAIGEPSRQGNCVSRAFDVYAGQYSFGVVTEAADSSFALEIHPQ